MLSRDDLLEWYRRVGLSEEARAAIERVRSTQPSRLVESGRGNVSGRYPSRKMGVTIQFESHRVELAGIYEMEYDNDVVEYYDQPPAIGLRYPSAKGKQLAVTHTPDYFVIHKNTAGWEEWKTEEDLNRLTQKNPHRYLLEGGLRWCCPPGEEYARNWGCITACALPGRSTGSFKETFNFWRITFVLNSLILLPLLLTEFSPMFRLGRRSTLQEILEETPGIATPDDVYFLIATGKMHVDLHAVSLAEPDSVRVFTCRDSALTHSVVPERHPTSHPLGEAHRLVAPLLHWPKVQNLPDWLPSYSAPARSI